MDDWLVIVVLLAFGAAFGFVGGWSAGCRFTRIELNSKPYTKLKAEREQLARIFTLALADAAQRGQIQQVGKNGVPRQSDDVLDADTVG